MWVCVGKSIAHSMGISSDWPKVRSMPSFSTEKDSVNFAFAFH